MLHGPVLRVGEKRLNVLPTDNRPSGEASMLCAQLLGIIYEAAIVATFVPPAVFTTAFSHGGNGRHKEYHENAAAKSDNFLTLAHLHVELLIERTSSATPVRCSLAGNTHPQSCASAS
jgi:hypothetical protein